MYVGGLGGGEGGPQKIVQRSAVSGVKSWFVIATIAAISFDLQLSESGTTEMSLWAMWGRGGVGAEEVSTEDRSKE